MSVISDDSDSMEYYDFNEDPDLSNASNECDKNQLHLRPIEKDSIQQIPLEYQHIFGAYAKFNYVQAEVFDVVFNTDEPVVISAPTGSGKTAIFEMAIVRLIMEMKKAQQKSFKIIYLAPLKALCSERLDDWNGKFEKHGIKILAFTGDSDDIDYNLFQKLNIIITTPEKWDSLTRRWKNQKILMENIKLFLVDEVHLLNEDCRGSTLEVVICRMKTIQNTLYGKLGTIRMVAVSATIPNTDDVAMLLRTPNNPAKFFKFGEEHRPVKLNKIVIGFPCDGKSSFQFDLFLNYKLRQIIKKYSENKPTLIFCPTRKSIQLASKTLAQEISFKLNDTQSRQLKDSSKKIRDPEMRRFLESGIGLHHGGLDIDSRLVVEEAFRKGFLPIILTTSTLSMGVNLPAHLVIVKSTDLFTAGSFEIYSENMILQMIGRAGRPQFDTSATAVILTKESDKAKFENLVNGTQLIESNLHKHLAEHINSEVVLKTIIDLSVALDWIRSTFLYVRALKNPKHYSIPVNLTKDKIEKKLLDIFQTELNALAKVGMLTLSSTNDLEIKSTSNGCLMATYYVAFSSMKLFIKMSGKENMSEILSTVCKCYEFSDSQLRSSDKKILNALNSDKNSETIRFPMTGRIKTRDMKINCIIQAIFGCLSIADSALKQEALKIMKTGRRLTKVLSRYFEEKTNCFSALLNTLILYKCFQVQLWENSKYVSKQLPKIGSVYSSMLTAGGKETFQSLARSNPFDIERLIGRAPPIGSEIKKAASLIPKFTIQATKTQNLDVKWQTVVFEVSLENRDLLNSECTVPKNTLMILIVGSSENKVLFFNRKSLQYYISNAKFQAEVRVSAESDYFIKAVLLSEDWVGFDCSTFVKIDSGNINASITLEDQINVSLGEMNSLEISETDPPKKKSRISKKAHDAKLQKQKSAENQTQKNTICNYLKAPKRALNNEEPQKDMEAFVILDSDSEFDNIDSDVEQKNVENRSSSDKFMNEARPQIVKYHNENIHSARSVAEDKSPKRSTPEETMKLINSDEHFDITSLKFSNCALDKSEWKDRHCQAKQEAKYDSRSCSSKSSKSSSRIDEIPVEHSSVSNTSSVNKKENRIVYQQQFIKNEYSINIGLTEVLKNKSIELKNKKEIVSNEKMFLSKLKKAQTKSSRSSRSSTVKVHQLKYLEEYSKNSLPSLCDTDLSESNVELYKSQFSLEESPEQRCLMFTRKIGNETIAQPILDSRVLKTFDRTKSDVTSRTVRDSETVPIFEGRMPFQTCNQQQVRSSPFSYSDAKSAPQTFNEFQSSVNYRNEQANQSALSASQLRSYNIPRSYQKPKTALDQSLQPDDQYREMSEMNSNYRVRNSPSFYVSDQHNSGNDFTAPVNESFAINNNFNGPISATAFATHLQQHNHSSHPSTYQNQPFQPKIWNNEYEQAVNYRNHHCTATGNSPSLNRHSSSLLGKQFIDNNNNELISQMNFLARRADSGETERTFMPFYPNMHFNYMNSDASRNVRPNSTMTSSDFDLGFGSRKPAQNPNINYNYRQI